MVSTVTEIAICHKLKVRIERATRFIVSSCRCTSAFIIPELGLGWSVNGLKVVFRIIFNHSNSGICSWWKHFLKDAHAAARFDIL